jgi:hypothetical protein
MTHVSQKTNAHRLFTRRNSWTKITSLSKMFLKSWMIISNRRFFHSLIHCSILILTKEIFNAWYCSCNNSTILTSDCLYRSINVCKICLMLDLISLKNIYWRVDILTARWIVCISRSIRLINFFRIDQIDCLCCRFDFWLFVNSVKFRVILTRFFDVNFLRFEMFDFIEIK